MSKKIRVLKTNQGRLANQLWAYVAVLAYCLERGYECQSVPFAWYQKYFNVTSGSYVLDRIARLMPRRFWNWIVEIYYRFAVRCFPMRVLYDGNSDFFLPPTPPATFYDGKKVVFFENQNKPVIYCSGWLFRNPDGEKKFLSEIQVKLQPHEHYKKRIDTFISSLRSRARYVIGVHIRQGDYAEWEQGKYLFSCAEVRTILNSFLTSRSVQDKYIFIICSDGPIDTAIFSGISWVPGLGSEIEDLYTLAATDCVIGSNSTFGSWAAYYGNIPFVQFSRMSLTWPASL